MNQLLQVRLQELQETIRNYLYYQERYQKATTDAERRYYQDNLNVQTVLLISLMRELLSLLTPSKRSKRIHS